MRDLPTPHECAGQPVSGNGPEVKRAGIPPVEDLFDVATDPIDFMSVQSFPASDPPSTGRDVEIVGIAHHNTDEKSEVRHAPRPGST